MGRVTPGWFNTAVTVATPVPRARTRASRRARLAAPLAGALAATLLAGCAGLTPGAAVVVDDEVVSEGRLDEASTALCTYFEPQLAEQQGAVPLVEVRRSAAVLLALRTAVEQLAEEYDVEPGAEYNRQVSELQALAEELPEDQREAFVEVQGAQVYVPTTLSAVGAEILRAEGDTAAAEDLTDSTVAGLRELAERVREGGIEFAPSIGLSTEVPELPPSPTLEEVNQILGSFFVPVDSGASVPVSDLAVGAEGDPGQAAADLPADQRCG